jgi:UDP-N-acetylmuramoyl-L-alanyl-D-glutamate--2,6-diaminopimelate ligase
VRRVVTTGTNGKTTTTHLVAAIVAAGGEVSASVTTVGCAVGGVRVPYEQAWGLAEARCVRTFALEATSYALSQGLAAVERPDVAVLTNVTRDHLDLHGSPEAYLAAKAQLFLALRPGGAAVFNARDPLSALLRELVPDGVAVHVVAPDAVEEGVGWTGVRLEADTWRLRLTGAVHAENAVAAAVAARCLGYPEAAIRAGLEGFPGVPGRFEIVGRAPLRVVDYAHTPDGLARTLATARRLVPGRVVVVFGCGGDRDPGKRGQMGDIAAAAADEVVVTTDNPRSEDPAAIASAVCGSHRFRVALDRAAAIALGRSLAGPSDALVVCGKGHEAVQELASGEVPFCDADHLRA